MKETKTILVADDEQEIRSLIRVYLEKDGYVVVEAQDGEEALRKLNKEIDLMVLDIMMPHIDGIEVLRKVRQENNIPIIILSAKSSDCDKILGLDLGADDFMVKPFNPLELVARVSANIRRFYQFGCELQEEQNITVKDVTLNIQECVLVLDTERVPLTSVEYKILKLLMSQPGRVFTKQQIYEAGWDQLYAIDDNSIMVCIQGDSKQLERVFSNIYANALKHNKEGDSVCTEIELNHGIVVYIRDTGVRIPENIEKHIFEPFVIGDSSRKNNGSGLGLSIASKIMELHHGKIMLEQKEDSQYSKSFVICFPFTRK